MKTIDVLHVPFCFRPDRIGGTEVFVESLCTGLLDLGFNVGVAAPAGSAERGVQGGIPVFRYAVSSDPLDLRDLYGDGDPRAAAGFEDILREVRPKLVHLHAFTSGVSLRLVDVAKRHGLPVVFTYHTPTVSCQRGTLLRFGTVVCDGQLDPGQCTPCSLEGLGLGMQASRLVGAMPPSAGAVLGRLGLQGGGFTALRMSELVMLRHAAVRRLFGRVDHVVAVCRWVRDLLLRIGVPEEKLTLSRQGLPRQDGRQGRTGEDAKNAVSLRGSVAPKDCVFSSERPLRVAFLGRMESIKGPDVLVRALALIRHAPVQLDLFGVVQGVGSSDYAAHLQILAAGDSRVRLRDPVASDRVVELLEGYDLLAVPSQWLETGPLVVLEAFAAGVPVLGSDLGGVAELVTHGRDGWLVPAERVEAWAEALAALAHEPGLLAGLAAGVDRAPRRMTDVAMEMANLYRTLKVCGART